VHSANAGLAMNYSTDVIQEVTELNLEIHGGAGCKVARHAEKLVRDGEDRHLVRINVVAFAARHGLDEEKVISAFLHASRLGLGAINYNQELVKGDMIPKTWKDLTNPKYKDKLVQGHIKASGTSAILDFFLVKLYGWEYFEGLRKNNILTHQSCDQANLLASGERLVDLCDNQMTAPAQEQGMPIATVFPEDGVFVQVGPIALLAKAPHPHAGKLFIDWLTSPAGQTIHVTGGILSPLESPEVKYPPGFPDVKSLKLLIPDPKEVGEWLPGAREKFSELFGG